MCAVSFLPYGSGFSPAGLWQPRGGACRGASPRYIFFRMNFVISGASGFIGSALSKRLSDMGGRVVPLERSDFFPENEEALSAKLVGADVVVNLAGANLNARWTPQYKKLILESRVETTRRLVAAINMLARKPALFVSTSAVGIYPSAGCFRDASPTRGDGFLSYVCSKWEGEALRVSPEVRLVITRLAPVLSKNGGVFPLMLKVFSRGLGARIGNGRQYFSWIMLEDLLRIYFWIFSNDRICGRVNCVAPEITDNRTFSRQLAREVDAFLWIVPKFVMKLAFGERAVLFTEGQCALPHLLEESGFRFSYPHIYEALTDLCASDYFID